MQANWLDAYRSAMMYLTMAGATAVLASLAWGGLWRSYRWLFCYLLTDTVQTLAALFFQRNRNLYAEIYLAGNTLKLVLAVFVVLELYNRALASQPALARFGRNTVSYVLACAALVSMATLLLNRNLPPGQSIILYRFFAFERIMHLALLIFLTLVTAFMFWFPVRLTRNSILYITGFMAYFLAHSAAYLTLMFAPGLTRPAGLVMLGVTFACLLVWLVALRRAGEETTTVIGHRWDPAAMERLSGQLDAINTNLMRLSRR
jgi:hypothetical protein